MPKGLYNSIILTIRYVHGDLFKHLGIDSSTDPEGMSVLLMFCKLSTFKC